MRKLIFAALSLFLSIAPTRAATHTAHLVGDSTVCIWPSNVAPKMGDAYNANPTSMALAVHNFAGQHFNKSLVILGDMLELGEYSENEHESILNQLVSLNMEEVWLVGELFLHFEKKYPSYHFFNDTDKAILHLQKSPVDGKTVLIKGSRGIKLEKVVNFL